MASLRPVGDAAQRTETRSADDGDQPEYRNDDG